MKKILRITFGLTQQQLSVCFTKKAYRKEMKKVANRPREDFAFAICTTVFGDDIGLNKYVIGLNSDLSKITELQIKALLIHELNHAVTSHMMAYAFTCDEYRSTVMQQLYIDVMPALEDFLKDKHDMYKINR